MTAVHLMDPFLDGCAQITCGSHAGSLGATDEVTCRDCLAIARDGLQSWLAAIDSRIAALVEPAGPEPMTTTGYRCNECGACTDDTGHAAHADGCGQPSRDHVAGRARWYDAVLAFLPGGAAVPVEYKRASLPEGFRYGAHIADSPFRVVAPPVPPRTSFVHPLTFFAIVKRLRCAIEYLPAPSFLPTEGPEVNCETIAVKMADGEPWRIVSDPDCPRDYPWPEDAPPEVAAVIREAMAAVKDHR